MDSMSARVEIPTTRPMKNKPRIPRNTLVTLPTFFAYTAAYGDLVSGLLALLSLVALRGGWGLTLPLV